MDEQTPSRGGLHRPPEKIESLLSLISENMEMDVAFVSEFAGDQLILGALEGDAESFGWRVGEGFPLDESYCKRLLDGRLPNVVPEARREDSTKELWVSSEANIGSYVAVGSCSPMGAHMARSVLHESRSRSRAKGARAGTHVEGVARELSRQIQREGLR